MPKTKREKPSESFLLSELSTAQQNYAMVAALVKKQDAEIAGYKAQVERLVVESRKPRSKRETMLAECYEETRTQLHDMFRKRNELRAKCDAHESDVARWDGLMKEANEKLQTLHHYLTEVSIYLAATFVVAVVSLAVNAIQWFTR